MDAFLSALVPAVVAILLAVFGAVSPEALIAYGVPFWLVPALIGLFTFVRNFLRNRYGLPV